MKTKKTPPSVPGTLPFAPAAPPVKLIEKKEIDRTRSATVQIFEHILEDILTLRLKPGESISILEMSEQFGTSRSPVREALIRLSNAGLIETFPQSGTRISPIRMNEVREVSFVRRAIEEALVEKLANKNDPSHSEVLAEIVKRQQEYAGEETVKKFYSIDENFHLKIAKLAGYPNIWRMLQNQKYQMDRLRHLILPLPSRSYQIIEEHSAIVNTIANGDVAGARAAMSHHLQQVFVMQRILQTQYPDYFKI